MGYVNVKVSGSLEDLEDVGLLSSEEDDSTVLEDVKKDMENSGAKCTKSYE